MTAQRRPRLAAARSCPLPAARRPGAAPGRRPSAQGQRARPPVLCRRAGSSRRPHLVAVRRMVRRRRPARASAWRGRAAAVGAGGRRLPRARARGVAGGTRRPRAADQRIGHALQARLRRRRAALLAAAQPALHRARERRQRRSRRHARAVHQRGASRAGRAGQARAARGVRDHGAVALAQRARGRAHLGHGLDLGRRRGITACALAGRGGLVGGVGVGDHGGANRAQRRERVEHADDDRAAGVGRARAQAQAGQAHAGLAGQQRACGDGVACTPRAAAGSRPAGRHRASLAHSARITCTTVRTPGSQLPHPQPAAAPRTGHPRRRCAPVAGSMQRSSCRAASGAAPPALALPPPAPPPSLSPPLAPSHSMLPRSPAPPGCPVRGASSQAWAAGTQHSTASVREAGSAAIACGVAPNGSGAAARPRHAPPPPSAARRSVPAPPATSSRHLRARPPRRVVRRLCRRGPASAHAAPSTSARPRLLNGRRSAAAMAGAHLSMRSSLCVR